MTYQATDLSVDSGKPIHLIEFVRGTTVTRFNSGPTDVVSGASIYRASHFSLSEITQGKDIFKDPLKITFARLDPFARSYILSLNEFTTTLTVKRMHVGMDVSTAITEWKGRLVTVETSGDQITMVCESVYTTMRRLGLAAQFELTCIHTIYSEGCGANKPAMRFNGDIVTVNNMTYDVNGASAFSDGYFAGGMMEYAGVRRFIIKHVGALITTSRPTNAIAGNIVALYPGCDKLPSTCLAKFNNIDNYLGFPWMPTKNPFFTSIEPDQPPGLAGMLGA